MERKGDRVSFTFKDFSMTGFRIGLHAETVKWSLL